MRARQQFAMATALLALRCAAIDGATGRSAGDDEGEDAPGGESSGPSGSGGHASADDAISAGPSSGSGGVTAPCSNPEGTGGAEICGDGIDQNGDGFVDEGCSCEPGAVQACYLGAGTLCDCKAGEQQCVATQEFGQWGPCVATSGRCAAQLDESCEVCGNGTDDDCDGEVDELCVIDVTVDIDGDCVSASCPPQAPYPVGCNISMAGSDSRGCVANAPGSSVVYFQEGDKCGVGKVTGTLSCSSVQGPPLDASTCAINKSDKYYPPDPSGCPEPD